VYSLLLLPTPVLLSAPFALQLLLRPFAPRAGIQTILGPLAGGLCRTLKTDFGELPFHALR
jgi:hypothetical protein